MPTDPNLVSVVALFESGDIITLREVCARSPLPSELVRLVLRKLHKQGRLDIVGGGPSYRLNPLF